MLGPTSIARVALYVYEPAGRGDARRLDGQVRRLAEGVCARTGRWSVATYADRGASNLYARPGLARLVYDASYRLFDVVVVDSPDRLGRHVRDRQALLARLADCGVRVEVMGPSPLAKAAAVLANVVLADMIGEAAR